MKSKLFSVISVLALILTLCPKSENFLFFSAWAGPAQTSSKESSSEEQKANQERSELESAQGQMADAYSDFYRALRSGDPGAARRKTLAIQILAPAQDRLIQLLDTRREETRKNAFNKIYLPDGSIVDRSQFSREELQKLKAAPSSDTEEDDASEDRATGEAEGLNSNGIKPKTLGSSPGSSGGGRNISSGESGTRPEWVLDGSNIPQEIVFPGSEDAPREKKPLIPAKKRYSR